jgi:hypothetical protein
MSWSIKLLTVKGIAVRGHLTVERSKPDHPAGMSL